MKTGLQLVNAAIMARLLAPGDFGLIAMAMVVTGFVSMFSDFGLSTVTIQRKTIDQNLISALFFVNTAIGIGVMIAVILCAPIAAHVFDDSRVAGVIVAFAAVLPISAATAQHTALLVRAMRWGAVRIIEVIAQVGGILAGVSAAYFTNLGYYALVVTSWTTAVISFALSFLMTDWRPSGVSDWDAVRHAMRFGGNLTLFSFANWFARNLDNALIGWRWGAVELGFYTRGYQLLMLPINLVSGPIATAVIPSLSRMQDEPQRWRARLLEAMGAVFFLSSGLTAVMIATSDAVVRLIYGSGWKSAADVFLVLVFAMFGSSVLNAVGWIYISLGRAKRMARWGVMVLPVWITGFAIGLPFGVVGVAAAFVCIVSVLVVPGILYATNGTPARASDVIRTALGPMLLGLAAGAAGRMLAAPNATSPAPEAIAALLFGASIAVTIFALGGLTILTVDPVHLSLKRRLFGWAQGALRKTRTGRNAI